MLPYDDPMQFIKLLGSYIDRLRDENLELKELIKRELGVSVQGLSQAQTPQAQRITLEA